MLELDIDYRPQCVAHALQVREFHSMLGRGARDVRALLGLGLSLMSRRRALYVCRASTLALRKSSTLALRKSSTLYVTLHGHRLYAPLRTKLDTALRRLYEGSTELDAAAPGL